jgi:hypothetical protein
MRFQPRHRQTIARRGAKEEEEEEEEDEAEARGAGLRGPTRVPVRWSEELRESAGRGASSPMIR